MKIDRKGIQQAKAALRQEVCARLKQMSSADRLAGSARARALLLQQPEWRNAQSILFFAPLPEEVDLWPLVEEALAAGKTVALPRFEAAHGHYSACQVRNLARDLKPGQFGIREPVNTCPQLVLNLLDFILVPGVAFDLQGRRVGRGRGFYDRLLGVLRGVTCGVAFDEQIVEAIPVEPHDAVVTYILTPTRWVRA
ncbi:5-formyltetrahydrofolate cyclo-ligase [Verrucomicrobia bacterium]|nr:5-formyltetrahydrofolate cyclo-ligase [Verrucomicrobiota bacterium]